MNKLDITKRGLCVLVMCLSLALCGCGSNSSKTEESKTATAETDKTHDSKAEKSKAETTKADDSKAEETKAETTKADTNKAESGEKVLIDYGDAECFEAALNNGENLEGKVVCFTVEDIKPDSARGFSVLAGEHLNFVSSDDPQVKKEDRMVVRTTSIEDRDGSWMIRYEKLPKGFFTEKTIYTSAENTTEIKAQEPKTETAEKETENTYEHNEYYDIVQTALIKDSLGDTTVIHKVQAKQDTTISASLIAYGADGSVIGKDSNDIVLTKDKYNFFQYYFEGDISNAELKANFQAKEDSFVVGERNAVEMVRYDQSGEDLYVTLEQTGDEVSSLSGFKLLFYKGDQIVGAEDGYFNIYAENLNGKGSTDVAEVWVYDMDFDRVEYVYEP
ncbi:MAG: hypothetical protein IJ129_05695 [Ruminococcus sp.]|nr:hypothetical protein [Ruminococcus sp.]